MIVRAKPRVWELFSIFRLSVLPRIVWQLVSVGLFAVLVVLVTGLVRRHMALPYAGWTVAPFTLLGVALSIFLGFRNSACYERWWEARRQLGALIGEMRSLARLTTTLPRMDATRAARVVRLAVSYTYALMAHLRGEALPEEVERYAASPLLAAEWLASRNVPDALLRGMGGELGEALGAGEVSDIVFSTLHAHLGALALYQVACERIKGTPTPFAYTLLLHRTAYAYCFLLPFGLVSTMGWGTPLFCMLVAYAFFGLDVLGDELEMPFGPSLNALPLGAMARTVEISLLEALGERNVPLPREPVRAVLT